MDDSTWEEISEKEILYWTFKEVQLIRRFLYWSLLLPVLLGLLAIILNQ